MGGPQAPVSEHVPGGAAQADCASDVSAVEKVFLFSPMQETLWTIKAAPKHLEQRLFLATIDVSIWEAPSKLK